MPASLFAVWAGRHAARVTTVAGVTGTADAAASLVVPPVPPVTDGDEDRVTGVTDQSATPDLVTPVTVTLVPWLRENREDFQTGNPRNPGNPEDWVEPWPFDVSEPASWRHLFKQRCRSYAFNHPHPEAARLARGDLQNRWHALYGRRMPSWQCAGCDQPIGGLPALDLGDGNRVHEEPLDCLIEYGRRWRGDATRGLIAFGLRRPDGVDDTNGDAAEAEAETPNDHHKGRR